MEILHIAPLNYLMTHSLRRRFAATCRISKVGTNYCFWIHYCLIPIAAYAHLLQLQVSCSFKNSLFRDKGCNFNLEIHPIITQNFFADLQSMKQEALMIILQKHLFCITQIKQHSKTFLLNPNTQNTTFTPKQHYLSLSTPHIKLL